MIAVILSLRKEGEHTLRILVSYRNGSGELARQDFVVPGNSTEQQVRAMIIAFGQQRLRTDQIETTLNALRGQNITIPDL